MKVRPQKNSFKSSIPILFIIFIIVMFLWKLSVKELKRHMPPYLENYEKYAAQKIRGNKLAYYPDKINIRYRNQQQLEGQCFPKGKKINLKSVSPECLDYYYYKRSMLRKDVDSFNKASGMGERAKYFHLKRGRRGRSNKRVKLTGINPYSHKRSSPLLGSRKWEGKLFFRRSVEGVSLVSQDCRLTVTKSSGKSTRISPSHVTQHNLANAQSRVYDHANETWGRWQARDAVDRLIEIIYMDAGQRKAQLVFKEGNAFLKVKNQDPNFKIYINQVSQGNIAQMEQEDGYPLHTGDIVTFEKYTARSGKQVFIRNFFVSESADPSLISFYKNVPDYSQGIVIKHRQTFSNSNLPYGKEICRSMDMIVGKLFPGEKGMNHKFDLFLTIDRGLQQDVSRILKNFIYRFWRGERFRAGVTVMDAASGDVLAMASYPMASPRSDGSSSLPPGYLENQNLKSHGIGSIAKLFVAAAILNRVPELVHLEVPCRSFAPNLPSQDFLGIQFEENQKIYMPLRGPCRSSTENRLILKDLFQYSPNQYIIELGLLSLAIYTPQQVNELKLDLQSSDDGKSEFNGLSQIKIGNNMRLLLYNPATGKTLKTEEFLYKVGYIPTLQQMPYYKYYMRMDDGILYNLEKYWVIEELETLFNLNAGFHSSTDELYEWTVFNALLDTLIKKSRSTDTGSDIPKEQLLPLLYYISPETPVMSINTFTNLRREFISFLLGGATNRWCNVKLCEAFSRLVTGKDIRMNLLYKIRTYDEEPGDGKRIELTINNSEKKKLPMNEQAHQAILAALEKTIEEGGTADNRSFKAQSGNTKKRVSLKQKLDGYNNGSRKYRLYSKTGTFKRLPQTSNQNSANYVFTITNTKKGKFVDGLSIAIYLEDRGASKVAVNLATELIDTLFKYKKWRKATAPMKIEEL